MVRRLHVEEFESEHLGVDDERVGDGTAAPDRPARITSPSAHLCALGGSGTDPPRRDWTKEPVYLRRREDSNLRGSVTPLTA